RNRKSLAVLMELAAWRERLAQGQNVPRARILRDEALYDIANQAPTSTDKLSELRTLSDGFSRSARAKEIIEAADVLTVRDVGLSRGFIKMIGAKPKVLIETTDDAINLPMEGELPEALEEWVARGPCCAFNTTTYLTETPQRIKRLVQIMDDVGMRLLLIPMHPLDAFDLGKVRAQSNAECLFVPTEEWRAGQIKKLLSKCTVAIGGRYHFLVFAGSLGLPFVGLSVNEYSTLKQAGLVSALGLGRRTIFNMDWQGTGPSEAVAFANVERNHPKTQTCKSFDAVTEWMKAI
ncbi:hypothetical protein LCGC14_2675540, partial [marine sediment metagenome]